MNNLQVCEPKMPEIKVWNGERVVTFKDIDMVHGRKTGTAKKNFGNNKKYFVENVDYYETTKRDLRENFSPNSSEVRGNPNNKVILFTESGYLMIVKSFTDDLSWDVQRQLVNGYFKAKEVSGATLVSIPTQSSTAVPKRSDWYATNFDKIEALKEQEGWGIKKVYHKILLNLGKIYDLKAANEIYKKELGYYPTYAIDIVPYFPELSKETERILNELLEG